MEDTTQDWKEHQVSRFPLSCLPLTLDGLKLVKLDASAGALLTASLRNDGLPRPLEARKRADLERDLGLIDRVLGEVPLDDAGRAYFTRLSTLARAVLRG